MSPEIFVPYLNHRQSQFFRLEIQNDVELLTSTRDCADLFRSRKKHPCSKCSTIWSRPRVTWSRCKLGFVSMIQVFVGIARQHRLSSNSRLPNNSSVGLRYSIFNLGWEQTTLLQLSLGALSRIAYLLPPSHHLTIISHFCWPFPHQVKWIKCTLWNDNRSELETVRAFY